jgi:hypothetical protein
VYAAIALVFFLGLYALAGAALAFNVWGVADRAANLYGRNWWGWWTPGGSNPLVWRSSGLVMLAFGASVLAGMLVLGVWHPPVISASVAVLVLAVIAVLCFAMVFLLRSRQKVASHQRPEPPNGRYLG